MEDKWIKIEDNIPEKAGRYWTYRQGCNKMQVAVWNNTMFAYNPDVTHWQPLPEPPKE